MSQLLEGKTAVVLGVANRWSIAYAIGEAFRREGAKLILTYQGERQRLTVEDVGAALGAHKLLNCDVTLEDDLARLTAELESEGRIDSMVHSVAFANREDLSRPFV